MSNENAVEIHRVYGPSAEKETLEVWRDNSINGQKVYTGNGLGKTYQEVVNAYCWSESDYVFTMTSTYFLSPRFHIANPMVGVKALISMFLLMILSICVELSLIFLIRN